MQELEGIVSRAMRQAAQSLDTAQVPEDVFWYAQQVRRLSRAGCCSMALLAASCARHDLRQLRRKQSACGCRLKEHQQALWMCRL